MSFTCQKTLLVGLVICGLLADRAEVFSAEKMQPMGRGFEMTGPLSTNESLLRQFKNERDELLHSKNKSKEQHLIKNKLKILDGKITFLETQLKHGRPAAPPAAKAIVKPVVKPVVFTPNLLKPKKSAAPPIQVRWQPYSKPELRHRIFLAMTRKSIAPQPLQAISPRQGAVSLPLNPKVVPQAPVIPAPQPLQPLSPRQEPVSLALAQKVVPRPPAVPAPRQEGRELPLPLKVTWADLKKSSSREDAVESPLPKKTVAKHPVDIEYFQTLPPQEPVRGASPLTGLKNAKTGRDWKSMSRPDKEIYILSVMGNFSRHDVFLEKSYGFYIDAIDGKLHGDPTLENEYVHKILLAVAYENEPDLRQDIQSIWK